VNTQFDDLSALLRRLEVPIGASEAHGLLCGLLAAQPSARAKTKWLTELLDAAALAPESVSQKATEIKALDKWFSEVLESLHDANLNFNLLLPDDSVKLITRVGALADFCAGFCYGVGLGTGARGNKPLPDDTAELIKDFAEIDSAVNDSVDSADEESLAELSEYVRVGVLLVHEELQPIMTSDNSVH